MAKKNNTLYFIRISAAIIAAALFITAFTGLFYPLKIFDLQAGALLQRLFTDFSLTAAVIALIILILTLLSGRLYCSTLCPLGLAQEFLGIFKKKNSGRHKNMFFKYFIAAIAFGSLAGGTAYLLRLAEPYTYFGSAFTLSAVGLTAAVIITAAVFIKDRFFCTNICPVGALLGLISKFSLNKIYIEKESCVLCGACEKACPSGCIDYKAKSVSNEICVKCLKCLNVCNKNAVKYGTQKEKAAFSPKRRELILAASAAAVFAAAAKAGNIIENAVAEDFADVILPPGASNEERFANKCLNCNLCVKVCPSKIIKKSDGKYGAVSIDYAKGFCKFDCNDCCAACPTGALKKLSLEEKQQTRIAMITPPSESFKELPECVKACPTQALTLDASGAPLFTATKCIGCGACAALSNGNISIYGTKRQKMLN